MRRRAFGLRPRLLAALVLTAVLTLAVAALALLSPLEQRLRTDGETYVLNATVAARARLSSLPIDRRSGEPALGQLRRRQDELQKSTGGQVALFDSRLTLLGSPTGDNDISAGYEDVQRALASDVPNHSLIGGVLLVAEPVSIGGRLYGLEVRRRLGYVASAVSTVRVAFAEAAAAGLVVATLLGVGLSSTLLRRLGRLRDATRDLDREGHEGHAASVPTDSGRDEIGDLARAFAGMHARLRRQEEARRSFVATASHELRTPLTSLDAMLELLEDDLGAEHLDLEDARERVTRAREQSVRLSHLATDLLDLSRLDADVQLRREPLELGELCRAVSAEFELRARHAEVGLQVRPPSSPCWVVADPGSVARIIRILLDNALRVSPAGSTISIASSVDRAWGSASVCDHGPGVPEDEREVIFDRFQRGTETGGKGGFGLGLAIGRELAARMGGALELRNGRPPGGRSGAHFELRLPSREPGSSDDPLS